MQFHYQEANSAQSKSLAKLLDQLAPYREFLERVAKQSDWTVPESSINLPLTKTLTRQITKLVRAKTNQHLKYVVVIGIGGSNLGAKAVYDAAYGVADTLEPERYPKMIFLDTVDPELLVYAHDLFERLQTPEEVLINVISKSGTTTESIVAMEVVMDVFVRRWGDRALERLVVTTDEGSVLARAAEERKITCLTIPAVVGGRYSALSAVGLFPLAAVGVNIAMLQAGAADMRAPCLADTKKNPAAWAAAILFWHEQHGAVMHNTFLFHPELESLGKWYRQLLAESIGKQYNLAGREVNIGFTPTVSIGSTDLHSVGQLYLAGPAHTITTFVSTVRAKDLPLKSPKQQLFSDLVPGIKGVPVAHIMQAILDGTKASYRARKLPFMEIILPGLSAYALGEFLQMKMMETMYLANLFGVNAFDQPNVELYKSEMRKILGA